MSEWRDSGWFCLPANSGALDRDCDFTRFQTFAFFNFFLTWKCVCDPEVMVRIRVDSNVRFAGRNALRGSCARHVENRSFVDLLHDEEEKKRKRREEGLRQRSLVSSQKFGR